MAAKTARNYGWASRLGQKQAGGFGNEMSAFVRFSSRAIRTSAGILLDTFLPKVYGTALWTVSWAESRLVGGRARTASVQAEGAMKPRWAIVALCVGMFGCFGPKATRFQSAESDPHAPEVRVIGDITSVASQQSMPVIGVGLVTQLRGTGGGAPPESTWREMLENDLKKRGIRNPRAIMDSPNCAMVIVTAEIPSGARKSDPIDVKINLPEGSRCTSLRGGYLNSCDLFNVENVRNISAHVRGNGQYLKGYVLVKAEGPIIAGLSGQVKLARETREPKADDYRNEDESLKTGSVWGGGQCLADPPLMLVMNSDQKLARIAAAVAERINQTFPGMKFGRDGLAVAKNASMISLGAPLQYRENISHYLRVVRAIPLDRVPAHDSPYRRQLADQLLDPVGCLSAAIRLEALGEDSVQALRSALSAPYPLSRFAAAQSLTYLRKRDGVEELTRLAKEEPALRGLCLTALASLDESICHIKLDELMSEREPDLRYGAFYALRVLDERAPEVAGEHCKDAYWLHPVASDSTPMIHYLTSRRTEFVLFGRSPALRPDLRLMFGDFTLVSAPDSDCCTLKRFALNDANVNVKEKKCSLLVADVLKTLADLGGTYVDAVDLLRQANDLSRLNCALCGDAVPHIVDLPQLARAARSDPTLRSLSTTAAGQPMGRQ